MTSKKQNKKVKKKSKSKAIDKFELYENAVQDPVQQVELAQQIYGELHNGKKARALREDFCGTFMITCEWVKKDPRNWGYCLDLDKTTLNYGKKKHLSKLTKEQQERVKPLLQNVISVTDPKVDVILGCNFSFNIFKEWDELVNYFNHAYKSLSSGGILTLEASGGPGMIEETKERRRYQRKKKHWYTYIWDQKEFDPITHNGLWCIHFKLGDGTKIENAFVYDWRLWSVPELRLAMKQAGFDDTLVHWEDTDDDGEFTGTFGQAEAADNDHSWIAYITGVKA